MICETITFSMFAPRLSIFLVSMPARVSNSAISSGFCGRSINSRSQLTENFMMLRSHCKRSASRLEESRRETERNVAGSLDFVGMTRMGSRKLFQKSQIVLREEPDIRYFEQNHCQPIHSEAKCVTAPFFRIVSVIATRFVDS